MKTSLNAGSMLVIMVVIVTVIFMLAILAAQAFAEVPECPLRADADASVYVIAIYAHESEVDGVRYTYQSPPLLLPVGHVANPCPCEGYPIGFEWYHVAPEFSKSVDVLVKSCGDTSRVYPFIFKDGFESGTTARWSSTIGG